MKRTNFLASIAFALLTTTLIAQNWEEMPIGGNYLVPGPMYMDTLHDVLYLGGRFDNVTTPSDSALAWWDGQQWQGVGGDTNRFNAFAIRVYALTMYQSKLYIGGVMRHAITHKYRKMLISWDGQNWDSVPIPVKPFTKYDFDINGGVGLLKVIDGKLFVGGSFDSLAGQPCQSLAAWNGTSWECYGLDFAPSGFAGVKEIIKYKGDLYVSGNFDQINNLPIEQDTMMDIARWTGNGWTSVGGGMRGSWAGVNTMAVYKGELYVAGYFLKSHGNAGNHIQKWDGEQWSAVGGGISGVSSSNAQIGVMEICDGKLYVVGDMGYAGGIPAECIAIWNGTEWCGLGSNFDNIIVDLAFYHDTLCVAGGFWTIDGDSIYKVAKWLGGDYVAACGNTTAVKEQTATEKIKVYPNPASNILQIQLPQHAIAKNTTYKVFNMQGKLVLHGSASQSPLQIDVASLPAGLYGCVLTNQTGSYTAKFVKR